MIEIRLDGSTHGNGRIVKTKPRHISERLHHIRRYVSDSPTAAKFSSLMKQVDLGDLAALSELNDEMEAKDLHLQGVANTRRMAITALDWNIVPAINEKRQSLADTAARYCQDRLRSISSFEDTLVHLQSAISTNIAVTEIVWSDMQIVEFNDIPGHQLRLDSATRRNVMVETDKSPTGIPTPYGKFIVFTPNPRAGFPFHVSIARAQSWVYLIKHFIVADWANFSELFGIPYRMATADETVEDDAKTEVEAMLRNFGTDSWGLFPKGIELELKEVARGTQPYESLMTWLEKKQSIIYLGQTLTTDTQGVGSFALGKVHDNVRTDIQTADLKNERRVIRQAVLGPMVQLRFPGRDVPLPIFKRELHESRNLDADRLKLEQLRFAKEMGLEVDRDVLYEFLGIPKPMEKKTEDVSPVRFTPTAGIESR